MKESKKLVLIGAGRIAKVHTRSVLSLDGLHIAAVVDPSREAGETIASIAGGVWYPTLIKAVESESFAGAIIAAPTPLHAALIETCVGLNLPVFCEKPVDLSLARVDLREGDTLIVWKLDRLGRSVKQLVNLVGQLQKQGVQFKSLTDAIDTGSASERFFFHVMASLAEMERELTIERTRAGLEVARQLRRRGGRKRQMTKSKIRSAKKLLATGVPPRDVASNLGVSVPTLYRWIPPSSQYE